MLPLIHVSCSDDYADTNWGDLPLILTTSDDDIVLDITAPQSNAVTFEWTAGSNFNTNAAITYIFKLGINDFSKSIEVELNQGKNLVSYGTDELNKILLENFGVSPGDKVDLEAYVTATVHSQGIEPQTSKTVKLAITSYKPVSSTLYLIGGAAPNGWSADDATKMNTVSGAAGGFVWQGKLNAGELKFITTLGEFLPSYGKGVDETKLVLRESDDQPDDKFIIPTTGIYKISANIINLAIHIETLDAPEYADLWFVGNPTDWKFKPMTPDASDPFIFYYNADLSAGGEFKIATVADFDSNVVFFRPELNGQGAGTNMNVVKWSENENSNDYKWDVTAGVYKIKLDTRDMKIDIIPFTPYAMIYMIGNATSSEWDIDRAIPLTATADPNKFTWIGTLNVGELKFSCDKKKDWNGDWFLASRGGIEPTGDVEKMIFSAKGANPDNKWKITSAGTYTIEMNQLEETIIIKKQ